MNGINSLDIIIIAVIGLSAIIGMFRGLVREVLSLAAWVIAAWVSLTFYKPVEALVRHVIADEKWAGIVAGVSLFLVVLVVLLIIAGHLSRGVKKVSMLSPADRMLGIAFGVLRGGVVVALVYIGVVNVLKLYDTEDEAGRDAPQWLETSRLLPHVRDAASLIERMVPKDLMPGDRKNRQDPHGKSRGQERQSGPDMPGETSYTPRQRQQIPNP
jgi:membrane protein required for colicin V production